MGLPTQRMQVLNFGLEIKRTIFEPICGLSDFLFLGLVSSSKIIQKQ